MAPGVSGFGVLVYLPVDIVLNVLNGRCRGVFCELYSRRGFLGCFLLQSLGLLLGNVPLLDKAALPKANGVMVGLVASYFLWRSVFVRIRIRN